MVLVRIIVLFTAFPVHESAHAFTAHLLGDDTAKSQGRISLNPFKHIDLFGTLMMIFVGVGWAKPVPINPDNFKNKKAGMALSSFAGPVSNLILAYLSIIIWRFMLWKSYGSANSSNFLLTVFEYSVLLNIGLAVFNLLPVPPLDGSRIITLILPENLYFKVMKYERFIFIALIIAVYSGVLDAPLRLFRETALDAMIFLSGWVDYLF